MSPLYFLRLLTWQTGTLGRQSQSVYSLLRLQTVRARTRTAASFPTTTWWLRINRKLNQLHQCLSLPQIVPLHVSPASVHSNSEKSNDSIPSQLLWCRFNSPLNHLSWTSILVYWTESVCYYQFVASKIENNNLIISILDWTCIISWTLTSVVLKNIRNIYFYYNRTESLRWAVGYDKIIWFI